MPLSLGKRSTEYFRKIDGRFQIEFYKDDRHLEMVPVFINEQAIVFKLKIRNWREFGVLLYFHNNIYEYWSRIDAEQIKECNNPRHRGGNF